MVAELLFPPGLPSAELRFIAKGKTMERQAHAVGAHTQSKNIIGPARCGLDSPISLGAPAVLVVREFPILLELLVLLVTSCSVSLAACRGDQNSGCGTLESHWKLNWEWYRAWYWVLNLVRSVFADRI